MNLPERGHIDHETIADVALDDTLVGLIYLLDGNKFDIAEDTVTAAEIEHFLGFLNSADQRTCQMPTAPNQIESVNGRRFFGNAQKHHGSVALQEP